MAISVEKNDGPIAPYDAELDAMRQLAIALDPLDDEQRNRIAIWLAYRYRLSARF